MENLKEIDTGAFRRHLIQKEFRDAMTSIGYEIPTRTEDVIVLSAGEFVKDGEQIDYSHPQNAENIARLEMGIDIIRQIVANKINKTTDEIDNEDILQHAPTLVLSGTTEQLPVMKQIIEKLGFPTGKIVLVDCGANGAGNTKTQFETINKHFGDKKPEHITFITSDYHIPRVARTGSKNLNPEINFDVIPIPHDKIPYNVFKTVRGEVKRIIAYAEKGDISKDVRPPHL